MRRFRITDNQYQKKKEPDFQKIAQEELKICFLPKLLNQISSAAKRYSAYRVVSEKTASEIKSELESLKAKIDVILEAWTNMSRDTLYHLVQFLESSNNIEMQFIDVSMRIEDAIDKIEIKPGPKNDDISKSAYNIYLIDLAKVYKEATGINGIKIAFTTKTSCQVGFGFGGGLKFITYRTKKSKISVTEL